MSHTLIFDIGKTNKKVFVFNNAFEVIYQESRQFDEIEDEDGFSCDNIQLLQSWIRSQVGVLVEKQGLNIKKINFSCYGASLVHLDDNDQLLTPLYNYLKPVDDSIFNILYSNHGGKNIFSKETASPSLAMLNAGLQLYWLSRKRPHIFDQIRKSMHFPNYCAFLLHGQKVSEYTSIGCHTALWNFEQSDYHQWVTAEDIIPKLPPLVRGDNTLPSILYPKINVGMGLHDSSAALVPYLIGNEEPFALLSTGTWSIFINPFSRVKLSTELLKQDCLSFLTIEGKPVMASRLFLGHDHDELVLFLAKKFDRNNDFKKVKFDLKIYQQLKCINVNTFFSLKDEDGEKTLISKEETENFNLAYHQLMYQLIQKQVIKIKLILELTSAVKTIYIDGGFTKNELFCKMLKQELPQYQWRTSDLAAGSSLGAAIAINKQYFDSSRFNNILNVCEI